MTDLVRGGTGRPPFYPAVASLAAHTRTAVLPSAPPQLPVVQVGQVVGVGGGGARVQPVVLHLPVEAGDGAGYTWRSSWRVGGAPV